MQVLFRFTINIFSWSNCSMWFGEYRNPQSHFIHFNLSYWQYTCNRTVYLYFPACPWAEKMRFISFSLVYQCRRVCPCLIIITHKIYRQDPHEFLLIGDFSVGILSCVWSIPLKIPLTLVSILCCEPKYLTVSHVTLKYLCCKSHMCHYRFNGTSNILFC